MAGMSATPDVVLASGGLLWRDSPRGQELTIVHRRRYGDRTLPKGKLLPGEAWRAGAAREVEEEMGFPVRVDGYAGTISYTVDERPKVVVFWDMSVAGESHFHPGEEVESVEWLPASEAIRRLTHRHEADLVAARSGAGRSATYAQPWRWRIKARFGPLSGDWSARNRLEHAVASFRVEMDLLAQECTRSNPAELLWVDAASAALRDVETALREYDTDGGWRSLHTAMQMELFGIAAARPKELTERAKGLKHEASKLEGHWRRKAIEEILPKADPPQPGDAEKVAYASSILYEHFDNVYYRMAAARRQLAMLGLTTVAAIAALATLISLFSSSFGMSLEGILAVLAFGVLGAAVSGMLSLARAGNKRIPELLGNWSASLARLAFGAASALAVYMFLLSGLLNVGTVATGAVLAVSFAAGFSERLVVRSVEALTVDGGT